MPADVVDILLRLREVRKFTADSRTASKALDNVGTSAEQVGKKSRVGWSGLTKLAGGAAALYGVQRFLRSSVTAASDLSEQVNKTQVVFGAAGKQLVSWTENSATALGQTQEQALAAAGTFGNMLVPMGFARTQAAQMSKRMVTLASDMASFNNASPEETLDAIRSGLAGETEPLRRYGVFLNEARLKQQAMSMGMIKTTKGQGSALTAAQKAQATYAIILKDTSDAQGDFARTSDGLANKQRILRAQYTNISANIGKQLLPVVLSLASALLKLLKLLEPLTKNAIAFRVAVAALITIFVAYKIAMIAASIANAGFNVTLLITLGIIGAIILVVAALAIGFYLLYTRVGWFRDAVHATWDWIKRNWPLLLAVLIGPFAIAALLIIRHFDKIKSFVASVIEFVRRQLQRLVDYIKRIPSMVSGALDRIPGAGLAQRGLGAARSLVPGLQYGGTIARSGLALVGERGPEIVALPGGATVEPLDTSGYQPREIVVPVTLLLDRQIVARTVARVTADKAARR